MTSSSESVLDEDGLLRASPSSIYLYSGGQINPLDPDPAAIKIVDIAHALSNQCRWTGHVNSFYSVAEHCVLVSRLIAASAGDNEAVLTGLLHDASEAYLCDLARPLKRSAGLGTHYLDAEVKLEAALGQRFGIPTVPLDNPVVKWADDQVLRAEAHTLLPGLAKYMPLPEQEVAIYGWYPSKAKDEFLSAYRWLVDRV